ncbi:phage terminase large subunit family protein [Paracoccus jeotgali]|uniref:Terminase n=1 Tax=Paracoccus jeotgali TaxID=2065379 RepID=A0A2K9MBB9_9RHOB|nr:terminase gpA endonuclease subunit [Paracoccus jeotgali]AUM72928.1 terminase [Paracoccus jeotgali]
MNAETFRTLRADLYAALKPPAHLDLGDWVESNVRLPATVAAQSGRMVLMPWQREVARSIGDPRVERVTILKSARVGATQLMVAGIGHFALNDPAPQLVVMPSESDCRMLLTSIIEPTFAASPALRSALTENVSGRDTMLSRHYPGGSLALISGASPKNLRARTARVLWLDEVDGLDMSAGDEGDPVSLAIRRTMTYGTRRKIVMASTPVDEATSRIARAYEDGDCRVWELPCPHCGDFHELAWSMIHWPEGKPQDAYFVCPSCGCITEESGKPAMIERGRWRATRPEVTGHHSYRLNTFGASILSTAAWGVLASEFLAAKRDPATLKTWINTVAGQVWRDDSDGMDDAEILSRLEPVGLDRVPSEVIALTAGVDVQHDRLEVSTLGWTAEDAPIVLAHEIIWGNPFGPDLWLGLSDLLARTFQHPAGGMLRYDAALIDSGDGQTSEAVYEFCRGRASQRVFACKGISGFREPPARLGNVPGKKWLRLQLVGVDSVKRRIMGLVTSGTMRFSDSLSASWAEQITGERLRTRYSKGVPVLEWHRLSGRRVEALDCATYAVAARSLVTADKRRRQEELSSPAAPRKPVRITHSNWLVR